MICLSAASSDRPFTSGTFTSSGPLLTTMVTADPLAAEVPAGGSVPITLSLSTVELKSSLPGHGEPLAGEDLRGVVVRLAR